MGPNQTQERKTNQSSLISRIVDRAPGMREASHAPIAGESFVISSLKGYADVARKAEMMLDMKFDKESFLLSKVNQPAGTEAISFCTGVGISNGNQALICHFNPMVLYDEAQRAEVLGKLQSAIERLQATSSAPIKAVVYSGDDGNGLPLEGFLRSKGIETLALINQKGDLDGTGYEGGFVYNPATDKWHVHTYVKPELSRQGLPQHEVTTKAELDSCFERITHTVPGPATGSPFVSLGVPKLFV
jgi:hypothetical protein